MADAPAAVEQKTLESLGVSKDLAVNAKLMWIVSGIATFWGPVLWGFVISPFPPMVSLFTAIYVGGLPAMAVLMASTTDFDAIRMVKAFIKFQRRPGTFLPGPGHIDAGYVVKAPPVEKAKTATADDAALIPEALWVD